LRDIRRWRWLVAALALTTLIAVACGDDDGEEDDAGGSASAPAEFEEGTTMADLQDAGEIVIGVKYDVPPFGFKNPQTGDVEGFDVDLGTRIAEELGVEPKFIEAISDNRIPFLQDGTADLILSTMTITTDRDADIDFSDPYYIAHGRIAVLGTDSGISSEADLAGKSVCTAAGSTYETTIIPELAKDIKIVSVDAYSECLEQLQNGSVDAEVTDDIILAGQKVQADEIELVGDDLTTDPYGAGVPDGDTDLQGFVNEVLAEMHEDGSWQELYDQWVGGVLGEEADDPQEWTLEEALENYPCVETC
jgi:glutamate transport system substrate-binding protein